MARSGRPWRSVAAAGLGLLLAVPFAGSAQTAPASSAKGAPSKAAKAAKAKAAVARAVTSATTKDGHGAGKSAAARVAPSTVATSVKRGGDPFARLKVVVPRKKLGPLRTVRTRDKRELEFRSRAGNIRVIVNTRPRGASVRHGRKLLGPTPLALTAPRNSTPLDITIRARGYMTLRTRVQRRADRTYVFKLNPAKIR